MLQIKIISLILIGRFISWLSRTFNLGSGSTWPGHVAIKFYPQIINFFLNQIRQKVIFVAGTNGKTTTARMIRIVLEKKGYKVIHNEAGANLLNGVVSALILSSSFWGRLEADYAIFEIDEATLPTIIYNLQFTIYNDKKIIITLLNLFRDQLDRYGEVDTIARKWQKFIEDLPKSISLVLNADDPQISELGNKSNAAVSYFGVNDKKYFLKSEEHAVDSVYCLSCGAKLVYLGVFYSHIGHWKCTNCGQKRVNPDLSSWQQPISGLYNLYNTLAAVLTLQKLGLKDSDIKKGLENFQPAFGRQEEIEIDDKKIKIFLAKNPVGMNEAIRTITNSKTQILNSKLVVLLVLNDQIPDGRDVSWIWDVNIEELVPFCRTVICSGERVFDLGVRVKYSDCKNMIVEENLTNAIQKGSDNIKSGEMLYILPTYSAMLQTRKIISGRKIL